MKWELATNEQLWNIISSDWYVEKKHIEGLVTEALNRNLFDHLIKHLINKLFDRWNNERRFHFYDLFSLGYIGIVNALKNYKVGKGSFKTFAYMNIKSEFRHHIDKVKSEKRKIYETMISLDVQKHDDNEESFLDSVMDETQNPEKIVVSRMNWHENFSKVTDLEREIIVLFAYGYSLNEIARIKGYQGAAAISKHFHRGLGKINPNYQKKNLKDIGLMTMTKSKGA